MSNSRGRQKGCSSDYYFCEGELDVAEVPPNYDPNVPNAPNAQRFPLSPLRVARREGENQVRAATTGVDAAACGFS